MWRISNRAKSLAGRPSAYDKRLTLRKSPRHRLYRKEHVYPGERTIMFNLNQPITDDIDPYKSACVNRCKMCGVPISEYLKIFLIF